MNDLRRIYTVETGGTKLQITADEYGLRAGDDRRPVPVEQGSGLRSFRGTLPDGSTVPIYVEETDEEHLYMVYIRGEAIPARTVTGRDERLTALRKSSAAGNAVGQIVTAPMPGLLKEMLVTEGEIVEKGRSLCILEAMKMENEIKAPSRLAVKRVIARPGTAVEKGTPLVELQAAEPEG